MSSDPPAPSFGDPNAQPPTPKQTPKSTSTAFPSPLFETPKSNAGHFEDSGGWTPRFAEEYSVFNSTPGNLEATQGPYVEFTPVARYLRTPSVSATRKRPLSAGGIAAEIATHVNHFALNPNLPPVEPSRRLPSSPTPPTAADAAREYSPEVDPPPASDQGKVVKKARRGIVTKDLQIQTATPPPSSRKGERKLAPKVGKASMQNDQQGFGQDFLGTPQQPDMAAFAAHDMFGYPMSAPPTAPANFWDPSVPMTGMELDFAAATAGNVFQTPTQGQRQIDFSWDANAQLFQDASTPVPSASNQEGAGGGQVPEKKERPLAPKASAAPSGAFISTVDDPFGITAGGALNPGLLFSARMDADSFSGAGRQPGTSATMALAKLHSGAPPTGVGGAGRGSVRRSLSLKEPGRQSDRATISSPIKPSSHRPSLQRSFSENRGKRALPPLAPAIRSQPQQASGSGVNAGRPPSSRQSGRTSPLKQHQRLSSLTSIPESGGPRTRTSVKFTIDSKGRARAETTVLMDESRPGSIHRRRVSQDSGRREVDSESEATDDEPIIIPSRNASFALPDPKKPVGSIFGSTKKSAKQTQRLGASRAIAAMEDGGPMAVSPSDESEAETVLEDVADKEGDATSELRKMVEERQKRSGPATGTRHGQRLSFGEMPRNLASPSTLTEASLPTPSTDTKGDTIRCICHRNDVEGASNAFMVKCESCDLWLHGKCVKITRLDLPRVYICAFCANTPNMRGGGHRMRNVGGGPSRVSSSPLAHKSLKFR